VSLGRPGNQSERATQSGRTGDTSPPCWPDMLESGCNGILQVNVEEQTWSHMKGREFAISVTKPGKQTNGRRGLGTVFAAAVRPALCGGAGVRAFTLHHGVCSSRQARLLIACRPLKTPSRFRAITPFIVNLTPHLRVQWLTGYHPDRTQPHPPSTKPSCRVVLELSVLASASLLARRLLCRGRLALSRPHTASSRKAEEGPQSVDCICCALLGPHTSAGSSYSYTQYG
jgi:hypothetical protein